MRLVLLAGLLLFISCSKKLNVTNDSLTPEMENYISEIKTARDERIRDLKKPQGWLSVIGLHWLSEGVNTIGAAGDNNIIFPRISTETIGAYQLQGDDIFFGKVEGVEVSQGEEEYLGGPVEVGYPPIIVSHQSLYWYVIKRGERYAIRLKDTLSEKRIDFKGIPYSEIDHNYQVNAKVTIPQSDETVAITNVLGQEKNYVVAAELTFSIKGTEHSIVALDEGADSYFVIIGDLSNGDTTYGGGRFLYPKKPLAGEDTTILDFNLLQNPPCAFSDFATCPLPPERNKLDVLLPVGELKMDEIH